MNRGTLTILLAIMGAIALHGLAFLAGAQLYAHQRQRFLAEVERAQQIRTEPPIQVKLEPPPEKEQPKPEPPPAIPLGGSLIGQADALNEIDLPKPPQPREADESQAAMARQAGSDAEPVPAPPPAEPDQSPPREPAEHERAERPSAPSPPPPAEPQPPVPDAPDETSPPAEPANPAEPAPPPMQLARQTDELLPPREPTATAERTIPAPADTPPTPPAPQTLSGDPLPQADSDSDPFGEARSVIITAGKVESRFGRKIKAVRPRIRLAGRYDAALMPEVSVTLRVKTDAEGNVISATIVRSSGSISIDQPVLVAMYDWWFEPPPAPDGTGGLPDDFLFRITFR